ncbi:hypothetical protein [Pseudomonas akapageensis]|uniref:hypothetical protein n=1 Tax=Pseudomonas akapageensis TaxID=2609961 RepID=UPI00140C4C21|nr:hypothetical protein [Pseudomonas akapageensis]
MFGTRTITSNAKDNKNKTNRLTHNKNNTAEAQLTDSFGDELYLGLAPQPGREQQKTALKQGLNWLDREIIATSAIKAIRLLLAPDWEVVTSEKLCDRALNKNKKPNEK